MIDRLVRSLKHRGIVGSWKAATQGRASIYPFIAQELAGKRALEIGGPSDIFSKLVPIYRNLLGVDNCVFASQTFWANLDSRFEYLPGCIGSNFIREGSDLFGLRDYGVILSCHNLEHFANPLKALLEWKRKAPYLVLVLPHYKHTFDHRRSLTPIEHMLEDFENNVGEDDSTHIPEVMALHDVARNPEVSSREAWEAMARQNLKTRIIHHHTFDDTNAQQLLWSAGYRVIASEFAHPMHLVYFACDAAHANFQQGPMYH